MTLIAVTGATGQVGRELVKLLDSSKTTSVLLIREPGKWPDLETEFCNTRQFDFKDSTSFATALESVERLFLVTTTVDERLLSPFMEAIGQAGVQQIVLISGMGVGENPKHYLGELEAVVKQTGIPSVSLRCNWFMQNFSSHFRMAITEARELAFPDGGAKLSFVDARDIAEVALHFLTTPIQKGFMALDITGGESLSHSDIALKLSKHLGYVVNYRELTEQQAREELNWDDGWLALFQDIRNRFLEPCSGEVEKILKRSPRTFGDYVREQLTVWQGSEA